MKYSNIGIVWFMLLICLVFVKGLTISNNNSNNNSSYILRKTRNLYGDIQNHGESSFVVPLNGNNRVYLEPKPTNMYYQAKPLTVVDFNGPVKVIEPKVAAEHVLYEFQQTPTDSISNVQVKQLFQPDLKPPPVTNLPITSETIVSPIHNQHHHPQFVQANPNPFHIKNHPLYNVQPTFVEPKKYVYGKIIVDSTHQPQQFVPQHQGNGETVQITYGKPILSYVNHHPKAPAPSRFNPPPKSQHQIIDKPIHVEENRPPITKHLKEPQEEEEEVEKPVEEYEEDHEEDHEEYETPFEKYFDDEDDDHESYEEVDEEDSRRGSTRHYSKSEYYPKKHKKYKKRKHPESDKYKYKHVKKSKHPRSELDGRFSENIPITHKKKILKEQWFVSKSLRDKYE